MTNEKKTVFDNYMVSSLNEDKKNLALGSVLPKTFAARRRPRV
jgi:hypothetical protein